MPTTRFICSTSGLRRPRCTPSLAGLLAVLALFELWGAPPCSAQTLPAGEEPAEFEKYDIALLPERLPLYLYPGAPPFEGTLNTTQIFESLRTHLQRQPYLRLAPTGELLRRLRTSSNEVAQALADATVDLGHGKSHFFGFNIEAAIDTLERVVRSYEAGFGELTAPDDLAQAHQYLAYSLMERQSERASGNESSLARKALQEMVRLAPHVVLDADRQPPERVALYEEARRLFLDNAALRTSNAERAGQLSQLLGLDQVLFARLVQQADGNLLLELDVYDAASGSISTERSLVVVGEHEALTAAVIEQADALLSRIFCCLSPKPEPPRPPRDDGLGLYLDMGFVYFIFLESPTNGLFDNLGACFRVTYTLSEYFFLNSRLALSFSGRDLEGDLQSTFNTFRGSLNAGISKDLGWLRFFFSSGVELAKTSAFAVSNDIVCKVWGIDDPFCPARSVEYYDIDLLFGLNATAGLAIGFERVFLVSQVETAFYVLPSERGKELNFPLGFDLALQYRF